MKSPGPALRVCVAGAGYFARFHLDAWVRLQRQGRVVLAALADVDESRRRAAVQEHGIGPEFGDVAQMLDAVGPDLLDIVTPPQTHLALVTEAARRGVACVVQKPLAPTLAQAEEIVAVANAAGIELVVHENFRWMPWYGEMKRLLDAGSLGAVHSMAVRMRPGDGQGPDAYLARQPYFQRMARFWVHETAIHFVDALRFLLGEVTQVGAMLLRRNPAIAGEDGGYIVLRFRSGATALIDGNRLNDHPSDDARLTMGEAWLEGEAGVLRLDGFGGLHFKPHQAPERAHAYPWQNRGFGGDCVHSLQSHIVDRMLEGRTPVNTGAEYLRNVRLEEAIYQANAQGRFIDV